MGAKEKIIEAAISLFCESGFKTTGIDLVLKKAGVAKMSLYYHFPSKEILIEECLKILDERNYNWYAAELEKISSDPQKQLEQILTPLRLVFGGTPFSGCPFMRASSEFNQSTDPIHQSAAHHKDRFLNLFQLIASRAGKAKPKELGAQIQIIFEGVMAIYQLRGDIRVLDLAEKALKTLLKK